jgi:hypothetical protein
MRKRISNQAQPPPSTNSNWLDLDAIAQVEISSEDEAHPIESALLPGRGSGWRASQPGKQTLRLLFDEPQSVKRIHLLFVENEKSRTQEFVLRWTSGDGSYREIVRQQYNLNPPSTELEDYTVDLVKAYALELEIIPSISGGDTRASIAEFRVG